MHMAGKRFGRPPLTANAVGHNTTPRLLYAYDSKASTRYLVDTGAEVSIVPPKPGETSMPDTPLLRAANGTTIKTYGKRTLTLRVDGRLFTWSFVVAQVDKHILGTDFLRAHNLLVDVQGRRLVDATNFSSLMLKHTNAHSLRISLVTTQTPCTQVLSEFPELMVPTFSTETVKHQVEHHIETTGNPVHATARRLSPEKLKIAKEEFDKMLDMGIIRRSDSPWSSPLHLVPKATGGWRPCGDYRRLNSATTPDRYPIPHILDFSANLAGTQVYSKIDLIRGYHQVPMHPKHIAKTAVITPFGLFEFLRMPFGLKNAAQAFQRLMDTVCAGLGGVFVYLDDILVASASAEEHHTHLRCLFKRLSQHGLVLNPVKCQFGMSELDFLGHHIDRHGAVPLMSKVDAITHFPQPTTTKGLQEFVGMVNFYHRFIPGAARIMKPLYEAIGAKAKLVSWSDEMITAFSTAKSTLAEATMLIHPNTGAPTALTVDASDTAVGAVLEQLIQGQWHPLAFFSKKLRPPEIKYSAFDRELLGLYLAIRHFRFFLEGRAFIAYTDHKPLTYAFAKMADPWSNRQQRHLAYISEYTTNVQHIAGKDNLVADALSRVAINSITTQLGIDYRELAAAQQGDVGTQHLATTNTSLRIEKIPFGDDGRMILCDTSTARPRPLVPQAWQKRVFEAIHNLSHPSIRATRKLITAKFVWHGLAKQVGMWTRTCMACQMAKVQRHTRAPLQVFAVPNRRFDHINIDLVGPLPASAGYTYLFTIVDRYTRWPEAIPLQDIRADTCARALIACWVARFGIPTQISSDRGPQFTSELWAMVTKLLGSAHSHTTAYHPQANGLVERFHRHLKSALRAKLTGPHWIDELPWVLLGIRTAPKDDMGCSSAELVYGYPLTVPGDFISDPNEPAPYAVFKTDMNEAVQRFKPIPTSQHGPRSSHVPKALANSAFVFVRRDAYRTPLQRPYEGPFKVLSPGDKTFVIDRGGKQEVVTVDRLKPAHVDIDNPVKVAVPRPRGRPALAPSTGTPERTSDKLPSQPEAQPTHIPAILTRSGRVNRRPARFMD